MEGNFDTESGLPGIEIEVYGIFPKNKTKLRAIIDTGFSGFLQIPFLEAIPLGLVFRGTETASLANGSVVTNLVCWGFVSFETIKIGGPIILAPKGGTLLGISLLKKLNAQLHIDFVENKVSITNPKISPQK